MCECNGIQHRHQSHIAATKDFTPSRTVEEKVFRRECYNRQFDTNSKMKWFPNNNELWPTIKEKPQHFENFMLIFWINWGLFLWFDEYFGTLVSKLTNSTLFGMVLDERYTSEFSFGSARNKWGRHTNELIQPRQCLSTDIKCRKSRVLSAGGFPQSL